MKKILIIISLVFMLSGIVSAAVPTFKWSEEVSEIELGYMSPLAIDINGDNIMEIFISGIENEDNSGTTRVVCIDGATQENIWVYENNHNDGNPHVPIAIDDLDNDGNFEMVIANLHYTTALNCEDGTLFWEIPQDSGWSHLLIADIDRTGYPYVYTTCDSITFDGTINKLDGRTGQVLESIHAAKPCYGGLSMADLEDDGDYELILTDRNRYGVGGNTPGWGISCYDADTLDFIWKADDVACSSHTAQIVDVNNDGILDVYAYDQTNNGLYIVDGNSQGPEATYLNYITTIPGLKTHSPVATADIDLDGDIESICSYQDSDLVLYDLTNFEEEWHIYGDYGEPPDFMNVMGDEKLEMVGHLKGAARIYNYKGETLFTFPGYYASTTSYSDFDNDGYMDILLWHPRHTLSMWSTDIEAPENLPRTDAQHYGERRLNNGIYVPKIGEENNDPDQITFSDLPGFELPILLISFIGFFLYYKKR